MYIHAHAHIYDTYTHIYTYTHTHIHTYTHTFTYEHTYIRTYIHTNIHTCLHTYIHKYIHTHPHTALRMATGGTGLKGVWTEHQDKNSGKTYYYNTVTKQSVWTKPPELKTSLTSTEPVAAKPTSGAVYSFQSLPDVRKYYYNAAANITQWTRPAEMDELHPGKGATPAPVAGPDPLWKLIGPGAEGRNSQSQTMKPNLL